MQVRKPHPNSQISLASMFIQFKGFHYGRVQILSKKQAHQVRTYGTCRINHLIPFKMDFEQFRSQMEAVGQVGQGNMQLKRPGDPVVTVLCPSSLSYFCLSRLVEKKSKCKKVKGGKFIHKCITFGTVRCTDAKCTFSRLLTNCTSEEKNYCQQILSPHY